jgi:hypothetical protein
MVGRTVLNWLMPKHHAPVIIVHSQEKKVQYRQKHRGLTEHRFRGLRKLGKYYGYFGHLRCDLVFRYHPFILEKMFIPKKVYYFE